MKQPLIAICKHHETTDDELMIDGELFLWYVNRREAFSLISSRDHCSRSSPSRIPDTPGAGFEPEHNLSSVLVK